MQTDEVEKILREHTEKITTAMECGKSAHHRIDEVMELADSVNNLAQSVGRVAERVELITERIDKSLERVEIGQREQGVRIGSIEKEMKCLEYVQCTIKEHDAELGAMKKAPGESWNKLKWLIVTSVVSVVIGAVLAMVGLGG